MKLLVIILSLFFIVPTGSANEGSGVSSLSPELQLLFSEEMVELKKGMNQIMDAYVAGQWNDIVPIAKKMENSYVLRKGLSQDQMDQLHSKLPKEFLSLDERFHYYSRMLAHVSEKKKVELIGFYFSKMSETCVSCHRLYATRKFPSFKPDVEADKHHH
ncbi:MAG TPA: hypothetical protein ENJ13_05560 [Chromatiales bacterium]|nr:hypothetical protein [Chromatiales bacterium]